MPAIMVSRTIKQVPTWNRSQALPNTPNTQQQCRRTGLQANV